ncbi:MAG: DUF2817 domain-containing protein [Planctomycetota bacterium]|nr:DUF2817 domain-containing protein [Planctomycetota bacterium]
MSHRFRLPRLLAATLAVSCPLLAACTSAPEDLPAEPEPWLAAIEAAPIEAAASSSAPLRLPAFLRIGTSVEGRPLSYSLFADPRGGPDLETVLILATIHGDENAGTALTEMLATRLVSEPALLAGRRVVLMPIVNPDGLAADRRGNAGGVDLNRNFDSANWGARTGGETPLSEPESRAVLELLERYPPDRVVSFHQPVSVIDYDGPAADFAAAVGAVAGLPVKRIGSRPGSLGSYVGLDLGLPILTVELPAGAEDLSDAELWERYGALALECVRWQGSPDPRDLRESARTSG